LKSTVVMEKARSAGERLNMPFTRSFQERRVVVL
jgi:hypothetical protein